MSGSTTIFSVLKEYTGKTWFLLFFMAALLYLLWRADKENRRKIFIVLIGAIILVFNGVSLKIAGKVVGSETYYRFLWMIPIVPILGYVLVDLIVRQKKNLYKGIAVLMAAVLLVLGGESCLIADPLEMPKSVHYVDPEIQVMAHLIEQDKEKKRPLVVAPASISIPIRLANGNIRNYIKRNTYLKEGNLTSKKVKKIRQKRMYKLAHGEQLPIDQVQKTVKRSKIDYIIIATELQMDEYMLEAGFEILAETGNYTIYRC